MVMLAVTGWTLVKVAETCTGIHGHNYVVPLEAVLVATCTQHVWCRWVTLDVTQSGDPGCTVEFTQKETLTWVFQL